MSVSFTKVYLAPTRMLSHSKPLLIFDEANDV